ncbi:MAG: tetratricopeptide repeat protein [Fuerstiella sp.]
MAVFRCEWLFRRRLQWCLVLTVAGGVLWLLLRPALPPDAAAVPADSASSDTASAVTFRRRMRPPRSDAELFVGNKACLSCHQQVWKHYQHSGMSQTWTAASHTDLKFLTSDTRVTDGAQAFQYEPIPSEDRQLTGALIVVRESRTADSDWHRDMPAHYRIGSGRHAFGLANDTNGYLTLLPVAWYAVGEKWGMSPGYELQNRRFSRAVQSECIACHGGSTQQQFSGVDHFTTPVEAGISCERCHGPGRKHVSHHSRYLSSDTDRPAAVSGTSGSSTDTTIVHPGRLDPNRANDICLQCHLQGDAVIYEPGCDAFSFRPGDRLLDHRHDFLAKTTETDSFGVASHGARMLQSKCWSASGGKLTCILCHDAHRAVDRIPSGTFDQKCMTCHQLPDCRRPEPDATAAQGCVQCHMPQRPTRERQHLVFTDHLIQSPGRQATPSSTAPVLTANANVELVHSHPNQPVDPALLGAAFIQLHETMGPQQIALSRGTQQLERALQLTPGNPEIRYWLAAARISQGRGRDAAELLEPLIRDNPGWLEARFRLGIACDQMKDYSRAIDTYKKLIQDAPEWLDPYPLLSRLYLYRQNADGALQLLTQKLQRKTDAETHAAMALAYRLHNKPLAVSLEQIDRALALDPVHLDALLNRGFLLAEAGRLEEARRDFRSVLKIQPQHAKARAGLQALEHPGRQR